MPKTKKNKTKVLAIDPGAREMGLAVFYDLDLVYTHVVDLRKRQDKTTAGLLKKVRKVVSDLTEHYNPTILVIEMTFFANNKNTARLIMVAEEIKTLARKKGLEVYEFAPKTVRKHVCESGKATKREVAQVVCSRYPHLHVYLTQDRIWKEKYWANMYDAVALGLTFLERSGKAAKI